MNELAAAFVFFLFFFSFLLLPPAWTNSSFSLWNHHLNVVVGLVWPCCSCLMEVSAPGGVSQGLLVPGDQSLFLGPERVMSRMTSIWWLSFGPQEPASFCRTKPGCSENPVWTRPKPGSTGGGISLVQHWMFTETHGHTFCRWIGSLWFNRISVCMLIKMVYAPISGFVFDI